MATARLVATLTAAVLLGLILWWPTDPAGGSLPLLPAIAGAAGVLLLLLGIAFSMHGWPAVLVTWLVLIAALLIRFAYYALLQFHGAGFGPEFFFHVSLEGARIAWHEHVELILGFIVLAVFLLAVVGWMVFRGPKLGVRGGIGLIAASVVLVFASRHSMPEWHFIEQTWRYWNPPPGVIVNDGEMRRWKAAGLVETELRSKRRIRARAPDNPKNLILLYLEGINASLIKHPDWPGLAPNLDKLVSDDSFVDHWYTSSDITMEGLTNTQCGTLFPFFRWEHDSFTGSIGLGDEMTCMGDVLSEAGYHQVYMGGALESFGGKSNFLRAHGYDEVMGWEYWEQRGFEKKTDPWGLGDPDLLDESLRKIRELRERDQPWNLTLLTLGTHVPGYFYGECKRYAAQARGGDDRAHDFLDALHCSDQLVGRWLAGLEREGVFEDSIVVITADHPAFPNPVIVRLFGGAAADQRLPLAVIGAGGRRAAVSGGAGYDLAPTVLDLLGIEHNARFALGRSLLEPAVDRDYFVSPYTDFHAGLPVENDIETCRGLHSADSVPEFPLDPCEKRALFAVLAALVEDQSAQSSIDISCDSAETVQVRASTAPSGRSLEIRVADRDITERFSAYGNVVHPGIGGLYVAAFSGEGALVLRHYLDPGDPPERYQRRLRRLFRNDDAMIRALLVVWQPGRDIPDGTRLPVVGGIDAGAPGVWLLDQSTRSVVDGKAGYAGSDLEYRLDRSVCVDLFSRAES